MDLILAPQILIEAASAPIDPSYQEAIDRAYEVYTLPYILSPLEHILTSTQDILYIPLGCIGDIRLRSTFARLGLISPPTIADPGFEGTLTLEIFNSSKRGILLKPGIALFSIHFLPIFYLGEAYSGKYQNQRGPTVARALTE